MWLSSYRRFWAGCEWSLFLAPSLGGFVASRQQPNCAAGTSQLAQRPAVYEFALTRGHDSKRFKVYIGETNNMWRRHHVEYRGHGDHLLPFMDAAVAGGCAVWRRHRYLGSKQEAAAAEMKWLSRYDYAWNTRCNRQNRHIELRPSACGCLPWGSGIEARAVLPPWQQPKRQQRRSSDQHRPQPQQLPQLAVQPQQQSRQQQAGGVPPVAGPQQQRAPPWQRQQEQFIVR